MPSRVYKQLFTNIPLRMSNITLTAFNNTNINVAGKISVTVNYNNMSKDVTFIVTNEDTVTILGRNDAAKLNCIQFLPNTTAPCKNYIKTVSSNFNPRAAKLKWNKILPLGKTGDPKEEIVKLFPELFKGIGCVDVCYKIELSSDALPVKHAPRRVPESVRPLVKEELDRLVSEGIIKLVECPTEWVNSIVCATKPNGKIRLCLDPKDLNKYIKRPHYFSPTLDDILPDLAGSKYFSTLDARSGYWNIPLDCKSQLLTTFNTPGYGRYCFRRLPFGLVSSQDIFQRMMDDILIGLNNAKPIADDIKIHGISEIEHDLVLLEVLDRCQKSGLHLNLEKCQIKKESVTFFGNQLTTEGMQPDKSKVAAISRLAAPVNKQELRSLVGMVSFLNRFLPNASALLEPLRSLLKENVHFVWDKSHQVALDNIKSAISSPTNLSYFDANKNTEIQCDASQKGLGACILQDDKPVCFASKSLTDTESRYSNIEREMLGVVFALTKFHQYTYGRPVKIISDHKTP